VLGLQWEGAASFSDTTINGEYCLCAAANNSRKGGKIRSFFFTKKIRIGEHVGAGESRRPNIEQ